METSATQSPNKVFSGFHHRNEQVTNERIPSTGMTRTTSLGGIGSHQFILRSSYITSNTTDASAPSNDQDLGATSKASKFSSCPQARSILLRRTSLTELSDGTIGAQDNMTELRASKCLNDDKLSSLSPLSLKHPSCHEELHSISLQRTASHSSTSFRALVDSSTSSSSGDLSQHLRNEFVRDDNTAVNESGLVSITSILILLFVTCAKFALKTRDEGGSLGAAAINSVTTVLGPFSPFTGGRDLWRDDYSIWEVLLPDSILMDDDMNMLLGGFFSQSSITAGSMKEAFSISAFLWPDHQSATYSSSMDDATGKGAFLVPRGGDASNAFNRGSKRLTKPPTLPTVISAVESFVPTDVISQLTLDDLTEVFVFAMNANRPGFDEEAFSTDRSTHVSIAFNAMIKAAEKSRGHGSLPAKTHARTESSAKLEKSAKLSLSPTAYSTGGFGDIDALQFCAAMRIFAEWRILRNVPEGYKAYGVGMGLGHKDVVQNLGKVENAAFAWIEERKEMIRLEHLRLEGEVSDKVEAASNENMVLRGPTIKELLQEEIEMKMHAKLPRLKEKSAGMGLLWVRRQLHYQTNIFSNMYSGTYTSVNDAVTAAYKEVYDRYHGWTVQKIFTYSFQAAPGLYEIVKTMNPEGFHEAMMKAQSMPTSEDKKKVKSSDAETEIKFECQQPNLKTHVDLNGGSTVLSDSNSTSTIGHSNMELTTQCLSDQHPEWTSSSAEEMNELTGKDGSTSEQNPLERLGNHIATEWGRFGNHIATEWGRLENHIGSEWDKLASNVAKVFHNKKNSHTTQSSSTTAVTLNSTSGSYVQDKSSRALEGEELENFLYEEMVSLALDQFGMHLKVAIPLLEDLAGLFEEFNMDDPTKV